MIEALQIKMKYLRSQGKGKSKLTSASSSGSEDPPLAKKRKFEAKQFPVLRLPPIPPGEDSSSNIRNQKLLNLEDKKMNVNKSKIKVLMDRTYAFRRADIMKNCRPIKEVLKVYPSLRRVEQVRYSRFFSNYVVLLL